MAKVVLNHGNVAKILRRRFTSQVNDLAQKITDKVNETDYSSDEDDDESKGANSAFMEPYTTDRSAAGVLVPTELQTREGALTKAAGQLGLKVYSKAEK